MGCRYALFGSLPVGLNSIIRIWMHLDGTSFLQFTTDLTIPDCLNLKPAWYLPGPKGIWVMECQHFGTAFGLRWYHLPFRKDGLRSWKRWRSPKLKRAKTRIQAPWWLEQCHFHHTIWWMKLKFTSWAIAFQKRKHTALKINTLSKFTTCISNDISGREKKTHNTVNKLNRAAPHYFLKVFLGRGLLIIFLAVHKEAFKYSIWASMNKDMFFPMAGIF